MALIQWWCVIRTRSEVAVALTLPVDYPPGVSVLGSGGKRHDMAVATWQNLPA